MDLDLRVLKTFRSLVGRSRALDGAIAFAATWLFYLLLLVAFVSAAEGDATQAGSALTAVLVAAAAVAIAEAFSWTVGLLLFRERPFVHLKFRPLVWMPARWKSFPSDHTTIGLTVACTFLFLGQPLGPLLLVFALTVGAARIAAGVHYPSDVAAGALLAVVVSRIVALVAANPV